MPNKDSYRTEIAAALIETRVSELSGPITSLLSQSFDGVFPVRTQSIKNDVSQYRPIARLPVISTGRFGTLVL